MSRHEGGRYLVHDLEPGVKLGGVVDDGLTLQRLLCRDSGRSNGRGMRREKKTIGPTASVSGVEEKLTGRLKTRFKKRIWRYLQKSLQDGSLNRSQTGKLTAQGWPGKSGKSGGEIT